MDSLVQIQKAAFIAMINQLRNRSVVDTRYIIIEGEQKLVLIFDDDEQEVFKGMRAA